MPLAQGAANKTGAAAKSGDAATSAGGKEAKVGYPPLLTLLDELTRNFNAKAADDLVSKLSLAEVRHALQHLDAEKPSNRNLLNKLYGAWAAKDPQAAWKAAYLLSAKQGRIPALAAIAAEYAKSNPVAAIELVMTLARGGAREQALRAAISEWAGRDFQAAMAFYQKHPEIPIDSELLIKGLYKLSETSPLLALNQSQAFPVMNGVMEGILIGWHKKDPQAATQWAMSHKDPLLQSRAFHTLLRALTKEDPRQALEFLQTSNFAGNRVAAEGTIFHSWLEKDLAGALDYLASNAALREDQKDVFNWQIIQALQNATPKERSQMLARLPDDEYKSHLLASFANSYASKGHYPEVVALLNELPDSKPRDQSLQQLGRTWGGNDPRALADWLKQQPVSTDRDLVVAGFAGQLASFDEQEAIQWAGSISDPQVQTSTLKQIAYWWMRKDREAGDAWLQSLSIPVSEKDEILRHIREGEYYSPKIR